MSLSSQFLIQIRSTIVFLSLVVSICSCSAPVEEAPVEPSVLDGLGIEDYEKIIRHPVSLEKIVDSSDWATITFDETIYHFDTISQEDKISKNFEFKNTGRNALYILDTRVSCGCTVVSFEKNAIKPGDIGVIEVEFDASGKIGIQDKSIVVISNSIPNETILKITGYVKPD